MTNKKDNDNNILEEEQTNCVSYTQVTYYDFFTLSFVITFCFYLFLMFTSSSRYVISIFI